MAFVSSLEEFEAAENPYSNLTPRIKEKMGRGLHLLENHPIQLVKEKIYSYMKSLDRGFATFDDLSPIVTVLDNFDRLLIPADHPSRSKSDTYYLNETRVLRTHTSAHQNELLQRGLKAFLVTGDVYRKDEIDRSHYPIFHQMEGVCLVDEGVDPSNDLLEVLGGLMTVLFPSCKYRVRDHVFPFTTPSFEFDVWYEGEWLEILGCGVVHPDILAHNSIEGTGWAWGIGLDRIAMRLYKIPDIRLLWSTHPRFLSQFNSESVKAFQAFSVLPTQTHDVSFWIHPSCIDKRIYLSDQPTNELSDDPKTWRWAEENDFYDLVRDFADDAVEKVECFDLFVHPKTGRVSRAYRMYFSPIDPDLTDPGTFSRQVLQLYRRVLDKIREVLRVELRS